MKNNRQNISAIIPTYQRPNMLSQAVQSVLCQTISPLEIIVITGGSNDQESRILRGIDDDRLRVIHLKKNVGPAQARNIGVRYARGEWIAFLDDDDLWLPEKLERQLSAALELTTPYPVLSSRVVAQLTPDTKYIWPARLPAEAENISEYLFVRRSFLQGVGFILTPTLFIKKELLLKVPFNQERYHEDWAWILQICQRQDVIIKVLPEILAIWNADLERARISSNHDWRYSLSWLHTHKEQLTPRARAGFVSSVVAPQAAAAGEWKYLFLLFYELIKWGKPGLRDYLFFIAVWLLPPIYRQKMRKLLVNVGFGKQMRYGAAASYNSVTENMKQNNVKSIPSPKTIRVLMLGTALHENSGIASVENLILAHAPPGVTIHHIATHIQDAFQRKLFIFSQSIMSLLKELITTEVDLVHIHLSEKGSVVRKLILLAFVFLFRIPVVIHAHGGKFHDFYDSMPLWVKKALGFFFRQCSGWIALSASWKNYYVRTLQLNENKVKILHNPVNIPKRIVRPEQTLKIKILYLGRISHRKGAFDLIEAYSALPENNRVNSELIIAGDCELIKAQQKIDSLKLNHKITLPGWVSGKQKHDLFETAHIFVLPSYNEGLPMAVLEAMAMGLPVISTPVGGISELISSGQHGILVAPGNVELLSKALQELIENRSLRNMLGRAARERVAEFDITHYAGALKELYRDLIET
ncbi:glycosyltransferase [candidate division CSSED10-310 bacterium]|uniref:Glycosyltransferase n=1 Tax=candidate division CSSED10-310 bacterium TaxID=2855610 RepID=A0ABV6Z527_UNCC1